MAFRFPVKAYTRAQLEVMSGPVRASDLEAIPHIFHDVQAFTTGSTTSLKFWNTNQATVDLGNFVGGSGQLPEPQFFQPFYFGVTALVLPAVAVAATVVGPFDDMQRLIVTTRPTDNFQISGKPYIVDIPLAVMHGLGGAVGGHAYGTSTTGTQSANNSIPDGGWCVYGGFIVPPKQNITDVITWSAAVTINASPVNIQKWIAGVLFRRVL